MYQPDQFVKLTFHDGKNHGFQYKEGLNEDIYDLNQNEECAAGGLYFCRFKDVGKWIGNYGDALIWKVKIPEGEEVIEYETKLKAKRIILSEPKKAYEDYEICKMAVQQNGIALQFIEKQTEEICKLAVQQNGWALQYVISQTEEICKLAIQQQKGWVLQFVKEQTPELCKLTLPLNGLALEYVKEQTEELCKLAVQQKGWALKYVKEQTEEICKLAVLQHDYALHFVRPEFRHLFQ